MDSRICLLYIYAIVSINMFSCHSLVIIIAGVGKYIMKIQQKKSKICLRFRDISVEKFYVLVDEFFVVHIILLQISDYIS